MPDISFLLIITLILVLGAEFVNGWTDAPNAIATVVSTRVLSPRNGVIMAAVLNLVGATVSILFGAAVANTIGKGIVNPEVIGLPVVAAAMIAIILWSIVTWRFGIPTSESHALIAGLTGAGFAAGGLSVLEWSGWQKVIIGLGFSTLLGFVLSVTLMLLLYWVLRRVRPTTVTRYFSRLQIISAAFMAFSHGSNDGQKFMGVFTLVLMLGGVIPEFIVPIWVILLIGAMMAIGTATGGWRIIKTMGFKLTRLEPVHGFAAETSAGAAITLASALGIPLSTTHTINIAIMGVGATRRLSAVRWGVAGNIVLAWLLTFPVCGILGYIFSWLFKVIA